jgi:hypothetical protein
MAPMLFHGLTALGLPVVCVESRRAYQALRIAQVIIVSDEGLDLSFGSPAR